LRLRDLLHDIPAHDGDSDNCRNSQNVHHC
jgi:hypothetical protein